MPAAAKPTLAELMKHGRGLIHSGKVDLASNPEHLGAFGDRAVNSEPIRIFEPRLSTQLWRGFASVSAGLFGIYLTREAIRGIQGDTSMYVAWLGPLFALIFIPIGIWYFSNALRGLPKVTVTATGVTVEWSFGSLWASWDSLGPLELGIFKNRFGITQYMAEAQVKGPSIVGKGWMARATHFVLWDFFQAKMSAIVAQLNEIRSRAVAKSDSAIDSPD